MEKIKRKIHILQKEPYCSDYFTKDRIKIDFYKTLCGWPEHGLRRVYMSLTDNPNKVTCKLCLNKLKQRKII